MNQANRSFQIGEEYLAPKALPQSILKQSTNVRPTDSLQRSETKRQEYKLTKTTIMAQMQEQQSVADNYHRMESQTLR